MIRKEECYRRLLNVSSSSLKDDHDTVIIGFKIISEDKTCTNSIYKAIIAYYHGASKRCRLVINDVSHVLTLQTTTNNLLMLKRTPAHEHINYVPLLRPVTTLFGIPLVDFILCFQIVRWKSQS